MIEKTETLHSFDVVERIQELETKKREWSTGLTTEEAAELVDLRKLNEQGDAVSVDWKYGALLIRSDYLVDYVRNHMVEVLGIPGVDFPTYLVIDWEKTAELLREYYYPVWYGDTIYLVR